MKIFNTAREIYDSTFTVSEDVEEPYKIKMQRWLNVGKASLVVLGVSGVAQFADVPAGFINDDYLNQGLEYVKYGGFAAGMMLGLVSTAGVGVIETQIQKSVIEN